MKMFAKYFARFIGYSIFGIVAVGVWASVLLWVAKQVGKITGDPDLVAFAFIVEMVVTIIAAVHTMQRYDVENRHGPN